MFSRFALKSIPHRDVFSVRIQNTVPAIIVIGSMCMAAYWAFLVPIFQSPDEDYHADYIFSLYSKGGLIKGDTAPVAAVSHPFVIYLLQKTNGQLVKYTSYVKMSPDYGSKQFFKRLDADAPVQQICKQTSSVPVMMAVYPVGYYALIAIWLGLVSCWNNSLTFLFFAARLFSVFLLGGALTLTYLTMRELRLSQGRASLILAAIAFFPLAPFVGSYIQPDNLSFLTISACFYFALLWRNRANRVDFSTADSPEFFIAKNWTILALGLSMAILLLSKYHFFCCLTIAITPMIVSTAIRRKIPILRLTNILSFLFIPSLIAAMLQLWISWDCTLPERDRRQEHWFAVTDDFVRAQRAGFTRLGNHICDALHDQYSSAYTKNGQTFESFWGRFGQCLTVPLVIFSESINNALLYAIEIVTNVVLVLTLSSLAKVTFSLFRIARKKGFGQAFYIAGSNPVVNAYFLFVAMMFLFNVAVYHSFYGQGRHWWPLILPIVLGSVSFAPRFFPSRYLRKLAFGFVIAGWLSYSLLASCFAPGCIKKRYYCQDKLPVVDVSKLIPADIGTSSSVTAWDFIEPFPTFARHSRYIFYTLVIPEGTELYIDVHGWAIDFLAEKPAKTVLAVLDDKKIFQAAYGLETKLPVEYWHSDKYKFSGYGVVIPTKGLKIGKHKVAIKVVSSDGRLLYDTHKDLKIVVE